MDVTPENDTSYNLKILKPDSYNSYNKAGLDFYNVTTLYLVTPTVVLQGNKILFRDIPRNISHPVPKPYPFALGPS